MSFKSSRVFLCFVALYVACSSIYAIDGATAPLTPPGASYSKESEIKLFPGLYFQEYVDNLSKQDVSNPYWVPSELEHNAWRRWHAENRSLLLDYDIVAYYGSPLSSRMGILGAYSIPDLDKLLSDKAELYDNLNGNKGIKKAFYIIYGTVWPEGEIGILKDSSLLPYIEYALKHDILIFLDHQIGRYDPIDSLKRMLPYLHFPNVHLALDPEWRTTKPMQEIGRVSASELNEAQRVMQQYLIEKGLPGERLLVVHQFNRVMIQNRQEVSTEFSRVRLIHCADGFGPPGMKERAYAFNAEAKNIPIKSFKLFMKSDFPLAGYDNPLMSPEQVMNLDPRPYLIMYQ